MESENRQHTPPKYNLAPLDNSVVFKKLFCDTEVLNAFIKDLLDLDMDIQPEQIETEKRFVPPIGNIDVAFDIFINDPKKRITIEIQRVHYTDHYDRFFYYFLVAILERAQNYQDSGDSHAVYTIVWLTRKVKNEENKRSIITERMVRETHRGEIHKERPHRLIFLNPHYVDDQTPAGVADWMRLVTESLDNPMDPDLNFDRVIINRAIQLIDNDGLSPIQRFDLINERNYEGYLASQLEEGVEKGIEKGIKTGELQTLRRLLANMLTQRFPELKDTGLPEWVAARIDGTENTEQLEAWTGQIFIQNSLDAIFE